MRGEYLFAFGHVLHYTAEDVDALSLADFQQLCAELDAYLKEMRKAAKP